MSYREYQKLIGIERPLPEGVTVEEFKSDTEKNSWYGTLYLKDGKPLRLDYYIWDADDALIFDQVGRGQPVRVSGGNGHYSAYYSIKDDESK